MHFKANKRKNSRIEFELIVEFRVFYQAMNPEQADYFVKEYQKWVEKPIDENLLLALSQKIDEANEKWASIVEDWDLFNEQEKNESKGMMFRSQLHFHKLMGEMYGYSFALLDEENKSMPKLIPAIQQNLEFATNVQPVPIPTVHFKQLTTKLMNELLEPFVKKSAMVEATRASLTKLKEMMNEISKRMDETAIDKAAFEPIVAYFAYRLLDEPTKIVVKMLKGEGPCNFTDLIEIMDKRMSIMADQPDVEMRDIGQNMPPEEQKMSSKSFERTQNKASGSSAQNEQTSRVPFCHYCGSGHWLQGCEPFRKITCAERVKLVARMPICSNCFRDSHTLYNCPMGYCKTCKVQHNSILCPESPMNQEAQ